MQVFQIIVGSGKHNLEGKTRAVAGDKITHTIVFKQVEHGRFTQGNRDQAFARMQNAHRHGFVFAGHTVLANIGEVNDDQNTAAFFVDIDTRAFFLIQWISKGIPAEY